MVKGKAELLESNTNNAKSTINIPQPELVTVNILKENPHNVKEHPEEQILALMELIKLEGFLYPLIIDKKNVIFAGHARIEAARRLQMSHVPCVRKENLTQEELEAIMLMDNRINESAWNKKNTGFVLSEIPDFDFGKFHLNFDEFRIQKIEETEIPEPPIQPKAKLGDIYQLGRHKIMCGNALTDQQELIDNINIKMVYTDPPYGLGGYAGRSHKLKPVQGDDENPEKFYQCVPQASERYIWGNWMALYHIHEIPRDVIIWRKNNISMGKGYRGQYEICMYFGNFSGQDTDVWEEAKLSTTSYRHPTEKPPALAVRAIRNSTKENNIVLDLFLGSGSTLIACEQTNRICYGMEIDPAYIDVIIERWENFTGQKAKMLNSSLKIPQSNFS